MDGSHDDTTQALVESEETTEGTEERREISSHEQNSNQFLSGTPLKSDQLRHQLSTTDLEESKAEDSSSQELASPKGDNVPVQDTECGETLEPAQDELQGSSDDKEASEEQEETQMESGTVSGQQPAFLEKAANSCNAEQQGHNSSAAVIQEQQSPYCEQQNSGSSVPEPRDKTRTPDRELLETIALGQGQQDNPTDTEQQGILAPNQNEQERVVVENEQQHSVAVRQDKKDNPFSANEQQKTKAPRQDPQGSLAINDQQKSAGPTEDQQGISSPTPFQQEKAAGNEQQEAASLTQHQQDTDNEEQAALATQGNEGDRAVDELIETHELRIEENRPEDAQQNWEEPKEVLSINETVPHSETIQAGSGASAMESQELDIANKRQQKENILESHNVNDKPSLEKPKEEVAKDEIAVEELQVSQVLTAPPDELHEENKKLKQEIVIMKQQEDAYRVKVLSLEQEVGKLRARKIDNRSQDSLASDSDSYLKQKLAETERELDTAERKVKDLQLRLKRFAKDDQLKDEKISQMEKEVKEMSNHVKKLEQSLTDSQKESNNNADMRASLQKNDSKVCVIL